MKRKIIRAFLAVYLVVSMAYGGIRAAYITVAAAIRQPEGTEEQVELAAASFGMDAIPAEPEKASATLPSPEIRTEDVPEETPQASEESPAPTPEETPVAAPAEEISAEEPDPEEISAEEPDPEESAEEPAEEASAYEEAPEDPEDGEDGESAYVEEAPAEDVPSLEEYLSTLHCGRCGRNCLLSSPRCRTGRRKAETETSAYYELYDVSGEM